MDVSDINMLINVILGQTRADEVPGNANVNGDDTIDVGDINAIINILLDK